MLYPSRRPLGHLPGVLSYLLHPDSFLALALLALALGVLTYVGRLPGALHLLAIPAGRILWGSYFFLVAHRTARGSRRLPSAVDFLDTWDLMILPLTRAMLATSWCWAGLILHVESTLGVERFLTLYRAEPLPYLQGQGVLGHCLMTAGLVMLPPALVAALSHDRILGQLDPSLGIRLVSSVHSSYAILFLLLSALGVAGRGVDLTASLFQISVPIPLASSVITIFLGLWVPLAQARLLGEWVASNDPVGEGLAPSQAGASPAPTID